MENKIFKKLFTHKNLSNLTKLFKYLNNYIGNSETFPTIWMFSGEWLKVFEVKKNLKVAG
jgi:hypothetical protein